jgi:hypothetical protein
MTGEVGNWRLGLERGGNQRLAGPGFEVGKRGRGREAGKLTV